MSDLHEDYLIRCPTCAASQPPASACRRCKCDLSLYLAALARRWWWRQLILRLLRDGCYDEALHAAQYYETWSPDQDVARWIAVAQLLSGNFAAALAAREQVPSS